MGGARGNKEVRAREQRAINFVCVGHMSAIFSCCVYKENVAGSRGKALVQGVRGQSPHEAEALLTF